MYSSAQPRRCHGLSVRAARNARAFILAAISFCACAVRAQGADSPEPAAEPPPAASVLPAVEVRGKRLIDVGPLPGLAVTVDQIPGNIQSATSKSLRVSRALNIADHMNQQLQGISANDYAGNPFQLDINYRGFTASPEIGTPQGLSVFVDGVRVNEPFGDVVNWDLIPVNAIDRFDLFPGSNPLFGLNTLGGALSVRMKTGITAPGFESQVLGGSFGRRQLQLSGGGHAGEFAAFGAATVFHESGWRDDSPSDVRQLYARGDWSRERFGINASLLAADNRLIGNGLIPTELLAQRREAVFTSPDQTKNRLVQESLGATIDIDERQNLVLRGYHRSSDRRALNGDIYEGFDDFSGTNGLDIAIDPTQPIGQQIITRNGAKQFGLVGGNVSGTGVVAGTPIGLLTGVSLQQRTDGLALQYNWNAERDKFMAGASIDRSRATYDMRQRLGLIDAAHDVYADPAGIDPVYYAAANDVPGNDFTGSEKTSSLFLSETRSALPNLFLTASARYNYTTTGSDLFSRASAAQRDLHQLYTTNASIADLVNAKVRTNEGFTYTSFNPSLGANWLPVPDLDLYATIGRGARVPSVVELGCAFDSTPVTLTNGAVDFGTVPRSLVGAGCSLPTTLSGDPYLPQIRSTSGEIGGRGRFGRWNWNASLYRTDLKDDVYFVGVGDGKSFFDTVGKTRRQGLELGLTGSAGPFDVNLAYSYVDATFRSAFYTLSPHNSSADFDQNSQSLGNFPDLSQVSQTAPSPTASANGGRGTYHMTRVDPGAHLPGIPRHAFNGGIGFRAGGGVTLRLGMQARSSSFVRGNENNQHRPQGTDQETGIYYCTQTGCIQGLQQQQVGPGRPFTNSGKLPGYAIFNLDAAWQATRRLSVFLRVSNLLDHDYVTAGRLGVDPFSPSVHGAIGPSGWNYNSAEWQNTTFVGPGAPRGIWVGVEYQLDRE